MSVVQDVLDSLKQIEALHRKKNDDYASSNNPFSNFDVSEYGLRLFSNPRDQSFVWPIFTKLARLSTLLNSGNNPNNESIEDSFLDIATYILLWKADLKNRKKARREEDERKLPPFEPKCNHQYGEVNTGFGSAPNYRQCGLCGRMDYLE